jgi:hypothetical protein
MLEVEVLFVLVPILISFVIIVAYGRPIEKYRRLLSIAGGLMLLIYLVLGFDGYSNLVLICGFALMVFARKE